ncbi:MAG: hypothetical protein ABIO49_13410 [Dokdonella sp.]
MNSPLVHLIQFEAGSAGLSGPIPSLAGLTALNYFIVPNNQLTGPIPSLAGLSNLKQLRIGANFLTGTVPSLAGLTSLEDLRIDFNQLRGPMPPPPPSPNLTHASLCPNYLDPDASASWDTLTGTTPWYASCTPLPDPVSADGFDG